MLRLRFFKLGDLVVPKMGNSWSAPRPFDPSQLWTVVSLLPYFVTGVYVAFLVLNSCGMLLIFAVSFITLLIGFTIFNLFFYPQLDYQEGVPGRLDHQLRRLEAHHNKNVALVHDLNGLSSLAAPG